MTARNLFASFAVSLGGVGGSFKKVDVLTDLSASAPAERARRYRELERAARQEAEQFQGSMREGYLIVANGWQKLAEAAEAGEAATVDRATDAVLNDNGIEQKEAALRAPPKPDEDETSGGQ